MRPHRRRRIIDALRVGLPLGLAGLAVAGLMREVDPAAWRATMRAAGPALPTLLALELARAAGDALAHRALLGDASARVTRWRTATVGALAWGLGALAPAGRVVAESARAVSLRAIVGTPAAVGAGAWMQVYGLWTTALTGLIAAAVAWHLAGSILGLAVLIPALLAGAGGAGVAGAMRFRRLHDVVRGRAPDLAALADALRDAPVPWEARAEGFAWLTLVRAVFVAQHAVLLAALGAVGGGRALAATGVTLAGGAAGDLIPGQVGALEGALYAAAPALGLTPAQALGLGLCLHVAQVGVAAAALLLSAVSVRRSAMDPPVTQGVRG